MPEPKPLTRPVFAVPTLLTAAALLAAALVILALQAWQSPERLAREFTADLAEGSGRTWRYLAAEAREKVSYFDAMDPHRLVAAFQSGDFPEPLAENGFFSRTVDITILEGSTATALRLYFTRTLAGWRVAYVRAVGGS